MDDFLWIGSALGAVLGLLHGVYIYRQRTAQAFRGGAGGSRAKGLYYGFWTFALWTLFGAYVLAFWILGLIGLSIGRFLPRGQSA